MGELREGEAMICNECDDGQLLPLYGVAPHDCFYKLGKQIGQSEVNTQDTWPENFEIDQESNGQCGIWHCLACGPKFKRGLPIGSVETEKT
jgi:hypothetical protein